MICPACDGEVVVVSAGARQATGWTVCPHPRCGEDVLVDLDGDGQIAKLRTRAGAHLEVARATARAARGGLTWRAAITGMLALLSVALLLEWTVASVLTAIAVMVAIVAVAPWVAGYDLERVRRAAERLEGLPRVSVQLAASGASYRG